MSATGKASANQDREISRSTR